MQHQLPRHFGKYILVDTLGTGGMAQIYLAQNKNTTGTNKTVAIKIMNSSLTRDPKHLEMMKSEAERAINFNHASVGSVLDYGFVESQFYIAMEYISGKNLAQIIYAYSQMGFVFEPAEILYIIAQAAAGLDYVHHYKDPANPDFAGVIHRDISADNIMVTYEGEIKIIDFGVANVVEDFTDNQNKSEWGKLRYQSPERLRGAPANQMSDLYALALVLWECCAQKRVYSDITDSGELSNMIKEGVVPRISDYQDCPEYIVNICEKATKLRAHERFQSAGEFYSEASRALAQYHPDFNKLKIRLNMQDRFKEEREQELSKLRIQPSDLTKYGRQDVRIDHGRDSAIFKNLILGALFLLVLGGGFYMHQNGIFKKMWVSLVSSTKKVKAIPAFAKVDYKQKLKEARAQEHSVVIVTEPHGVEVKTLNGKKMGTTPLAISKTQPMPMTLVLQLKKFRPQEITINRDSSEIFLRLLSE